MKLYEADERPRRPLSEREREILKLVAAGCTHKEIAAKLGISKGTVKHHGSSILLKLGARSSAHAVMLVYGKK